MNTIDKESKNIIFEFFKTKFNLKIKRSAQNNWIGFGYHSVDTRLHGPAIIRFQTDSFYIVCQHNCKINMTDCKHFIKISYTTPFEQYYEKLKLIIQNWPGRINRAH
jgi:hypothetical protein